MPHEQIEDSYTVGTMEHIRQKVGENTGSYGGLGPDEARFLIGVVDQLRASLSAAEGERDELTHFVERLKEEESRLRDSRIQWRERSAQHEMNLSDVTAERDSLLTKLHAAEGERDRAREEVAAAEKEGAMSFACWLIDNAEREFITEEFIQRQCSDFIRSLSATKEGK